MFRKRLKINYYIYIAVAGLLVFLYFVGFLQPVKSVFDLVLSPVNGFFYSGGAVINETYDSRINKQDQQAENQRLKDRLVEIVQRNADIEKLEQENQILREFLGFTERNDYGYKMANILSRDDIDDNDNYKSFIIDKGSRDGIKPGLAVVDSRGVVLGKIDSVNERSSRVLTNTNKHCKFAVATVGSESTNGLSYGDLGLTIKMSYIPQALDISPGDSIVTSGLEEDVPRGLLIGEVNEVLRESNEVWQEVVIEPLADYANAYIVSVILN